MPVENHRHQGDRGQVVVIFAGAMLLFVLLAAAVIDLSWYWTSNLKMQRAADAAALAGVVYLPNTGNPATDKAYPAALAEAAKNGYSAATGYTVSPLQEPNNDRRLKVTIEGDIGTFFARIAGINSFPAKRESKADFVLPVPMGSPQQWYGVGTFEKLIGTPGAPVAGPTANTGYRIRGTTAAGTPAGGWTTPNFADANNDGSYAVSQTVTGSFQQWGQFGLTGGTGAIPPGAVIEGIEVQYRARLTGSNTPTSGCQLQTQLSWDAGRTWTTTAVNQNLITTETPYPQGSASSLAAWPRPGGAAAWVDSSFQDANFRVRLTWNKVACGALRTASVDTLAVQVTYHSMVPGPITFNPATVAVPTPPGESVAPTSQGFWGAIFTAGGVRRNGDRYAPRWYFTGSSAANTEHIDGGYDYTIEIGSSNGRVHLFDPAFCATGSNPAGSGNYGAGDHWTDLPASGGTANGPVTTEFRLYDTNNTPLNQGDDTLVKTLPFTTRASDQSGQFDDPAVGGSGAGDIPTGAPITDCQGTANGHNTWLTMQTGLPAGTYRLNVMSSQAGNAATGAENLWSIYVGDNGGAGSARVYGESKMVAYSNLTGSAARQEFYLAQIDKVHAGKTMEIQLFDPGDVAGNATLRIKSPDGNSYNYASFSYQADSQCIGGRSDNCSGSDVTSIRTAVNGSSSFDNSVITITIPLLSTYGSVGLKPIGETEAGWWKIEYEVGAANDTTTWQVSIRGNPVHLVLP